MVVVDNSHRDRQRRIDFEGEEEGRRQPLQEEDAVDVAIKNFSPQMRKAMSLLSHHKVGPLQQRLYLSNFQSSAIASLPTNASTSDVKPRYYDSFVLAFPYFCEEISAIFNTSFMVRWSIIAQCDRVDKAPEVILLRMDDPSIGHGDATLQRSQRPQQPPRRHITTYQIFQERFWQQYVASDTFHMQCLTKWEKMNDDNSLQYCVLADQLYECYAHFQLYKLKMSLKSTPLMNQPQPPPQLIQAYTQFKQLSKMSNSTTAEVDSVPADVIAEIFVDLEGITYMKEGITYMKDCEERRIQTIPAPIVFMRAIISIVSTEQTASALPLNSEITRSNDNNKELLRLASVATTFPPITNKNATSPCNNNGNMSKKYLIKILNPKLYHTTPEGANMARMLNATTGQCLDITIIDFVTYVRRVQHAAVRAYNGEICSADEDKASSDVSEENSINLLFIALYDAFCNGYSDDNCLIDYQIGNHDTTTKKNSNFIRFLLYDDDIDTATSPLKYILTIEYIKEIFNECKNSRDEDDTDQIKMKKLVPVVLLRSVYDDENCDQKLEFDISEIIAEADNNYEKYINELACLIRAGVLNGIRRFRKDVVTPVLTRYNKKWSPTDPYFIRSLATPPPYPSQNKS